LYKLSKYMRDKQYQRIDWSVAIFKEQYPEIWGILAQAYLARYSKSETER
jgi:hypothetical protein